LVTETTQFYNFTLQETFWTTILLRVYDVPVFISLPCIIISFSNLMFGIFQNKMSSEYSICYQEK